MKNKASEDKIAIIGLGYVGLPLAIEFGKILNITGFDINKRRIKELSDRIDLTKQVSKKDFAKAKKLNFTSKIKDIKDCNIYIVTVPTPKDLLQKPDLTMIKTATTMLSKIIKKNDIIVYESTVYPGVTEDFCVPILEQNSGLRYINEENKEKNTIGFYCGY